VHEGQHPSIVGRDLWDRVQHKLEDHAASVKGRRTRQASDALLVGKLFDDRGNRMSPTWARKGPKRWRYYVSQAALQGEKDRAGSVARVSASEIDTRVAEALRKALLKFEPGAFAAAGDQAAKVNGVGTERSQSSIDGEYEASNHHGEFRDLIDRVTIGKALIKIALSASARSEGEANVLSIPWIAPSPYRRREILHGASDGGRGLIPMPQGARTILIEAIRQAHRWRDRLQSDPTETIETIASKQGKTERSIRMTLSLAFLAPDIVGAAIEGRLPRGFGLKRLVDLPVAWPEQWRALGLSAPTQT
jgi:site-specific DNA recombinase